MSNQLSGNFMLAISGNQMDIKIYIWYIISDSINNQVKGWLQEKF